MRTLGIAVLVAVGALAASADAAPAGAIELGFVRVHSISLASRDGTHQRVVLRAGPRSEYWSPA